MEKQTLETSRIDRQNILNNGPAVKEIEKYLGISGWNIFDGLYFTIKQVADYYDVDIRTIERYLEQNSDELKQNGYEILTWNRLVEAKKSDVSDIYVGDKSPKVWLFSFPAFLNIGMLLTESEVAKNMRKVILGIVLDYINKRAWGNVKYINQNDENFLETYKDSIYYRNEFTSALNKYIIGGVYKYPYFTDLVYQAIFWENARQYKQLLKLAKKDNPRHTFYTEVLTLVSSFEHGFTEELKKQNKRLTVLEAKELFNKAKDNPYLTPVIQQAKKTMVTRDKALRDILHETLEEYISALTPEEYEKFCNENSEFIWNDTQKFIKILDKNKDILMRLKDK